MEALPQIMHLGVVEDALDSPCSQHTALLKYLKKWLESDILHGSGVDLKYDNRGVYVVKLSADGWINTVRLRLADRPEMEQPQGDKRVLDKQWVDLLVISKWMDECFKSPERCDNPMEIMRVVPDLLVDVRRKCIVDGKESHRYMALSYHLGKATPFHLGLRDLAAFRKDGVLEDVQILAKLPLTVRHAILLTERLGYDYLWTDVLCVVHDGPTTLADQLNKMSAIYASAATTIVATDGDGADRIAGLHGISGPRDLQQAAFAIRDQHLIIEEKITDADTVNIDYHLRGWTYQEKLMSPRQIIFANQQAYWSCQCTSKQESDGRARYVMSWHIEGPCGFIRRGYPDLKDVSALLSAYSTRDLTYPADALPAVSGLLTVLSRGFGDSFLYGLPERFFDIVLGWRPWSHETEGKIEGTCRLRRGSSLDCKPHNTILVASAMPS
jgi:hypothetical protein